MIGLKSTRRNISGIYYRDILLMIIMNGLGGIEMANYTEQTDLPASMQMEHKNGG